MTPLADLIVTLGEAVVCDPDVVESYSRDRSAWTPSGSPLAMVRVKETREVQELARWATRHGIALVPRGAGSGVSGGASATQGCVIVSFDSMNRILEIDEAAKLAVVQPGVLNADLKRAAGERGLFYPPDPSSYDISSLGGNVATNAGGLCCVKYGVTGDYVLGLEAVRADGTIIRTGGRNRKDVAGYDFTRLLVGSEGTLAMITEITLRLVGAPPPASTLLAMFDSLTSAGRAVSEITRLVVPSMLELMDRGAVSAVESFARLGLDLQAAAILIVQSDARLEAELRIIQGACEANQSTETLMTADPAEAAMLVQARRLAYPALERLGTVLIGDVTVPIPALPELLRRIDVIAADCSTTIATVAHAGDGNVHPLVVFQPFDVEAERRAAKALDLITEGALDLRGTITGEHGIGLSRVGYLERQIGRPMLDLHRAVKRAFDPDGLLNPGKVFASDARVDALASK